jgi:hypothetical protein
MSAAERHTTDDTGGDTADSRGHSPGQGAAGNWAKRHLARQWWLYGLVLAGWWVLRSLSKGYSPLVTGIGVVPAFALGAASLVLRRRREARAVGGDVDMDELPELELMLKRRQVPDDPTRRQQVLALVRWRQSRSRRAWPIELVVLTLFYLLLGVLLMLTGHPAAGLAIGGVGTVAVGGGGFLLMRFARRRLDRFESRLSTAH